MPNVRVDPKGFPRYLWTQVGVKAAILRREKLLILQRSQRPPHAGQWDLAGGGVEEGESLEQALRREVLEETGYRPRIGPPVFVGTSSWRKTPTLTIPFVVITYRCEVTGSKEPRLDRNEHTAYRWILPTEISHYRMPSHMAAAARRAFATVVRRSP